MLKKIKIAIIGASGYTGVELIRILLNHQNAEIANLVASANAGKEIQEIYPHFLGYNLPKIQKLEEINLKNIDLLFCCLPHATSQKIISDILSDKDLNHLKIIDLSADFRLSNVEDYKQWYGLDHIAPDLQELAIYGLSEFARSDIKKLQPRLISCPGCYPTSALIPLIPLLKSKIIKADNIIIDSKSGLSGAGRALKENLLFTEINEGVKAYNVNIHRHLAEIEQELQNIDGGNTKISFTPHLVPMNRGIISTIYVDLEDKIKVLDAKNALETQFEDEYFVELVEGYPSTRDVLATNNCKIALFESRISGKMVIISVIDNLTKGSSGQAVQNMNILFDLDEREGLNLLPVFP